MSRKVAPPPVAWNGRNRFGAAQPQAGRGRTAPPPITWRTVPVGSLQAKAAPGPAGSRPPPPPIVWRTAPAGSLQAKAGTPNPAAARLPPAAPPTAGARWTPGAGLSAQCRIVQRSAAPDEDLHEEDDEDETPVPVLMLDVKKIYENWQPSQRDQNIKEDSVKYHTGLFSKGGKIKPIFFEKLVTPEDGGVFIRTGDGRHRLTACYKLGIAKIPVVKTDVAEQAQMIFDL